MAIGTRKNQLKNACAWSPQKSHHYPEMFLKECPFIFVDRIKRKNSPSLKKALWCGYPYVGIYMWGFFPGTFAKKCLFKSWMLIGFSEDVSLKNDDWFLKTTLKPTKCPFFKECQKCFLLKMPMHAPHAALQNDPLKPCFKEHKFPHFAKEILRGILKPLPKYPPWN